MIDEMVQNMLQKNKANERGDGWENHLLLRQFYTADAQNFKIDAVIKKRGRANKEAADTQEYM
ncbi:MAG: hypothetical protein Q8N95_10715 [Desulfobacterales bacterium]|nr:hypothetical protein [Desulfobacterales bacterium]